MNSKLILADLIVLFVIGFTFFVRMSEQGYEIENENTPNLEDASENSNQNQIEKVENLASDSVSLEILSAHNLETDCWIVYDGKVYDITSFLPNHPGSAGAIVPYCGTADEFQKAFEKQHGKSKVALLMRVGSFIGDFDVVGNLND